MNHKPSTLIAAGVASLMLVSTAFADVSRNVRVGYADLNLGTDAGVGRLYRRLIVASQSVCESSSFRDFVDKECAAHALDAAVTAVNNERLAALHAHGRSA